MKLKYVLIVCLAFATQMSYSQKDINQLFKKYSKMENVSRLTMGNFSLKLIGAFKNVMGVDGIEVLSLDECDTTTINEFISTVKSLKDPRFETMVQSNEGNSRTRVFVRIEKDRIRELIVLTAGESNALVRIKGNIKPSDIDTLINS
jgi:hypothetical protein